MSATDRLFLVMRLAAEDDLPLTLPAHQLQRVVARLDALESAEAELTELRASLETRSPED